MCQCFPLKCCCFLHNISRAVERTQGVQNICLHCLVHKLHWNNRCLFPMTLIWFTRFTKCIQKTVIIRLEARRVLAMFTLSAITAPKVNGSGWNLEHSEYIVWAGPDRFCVRSSDSCRAMRIFCQVATYDFTDFLSTKFHEIWTQHVDPCRDKNFRNWILKIFPWRVFFQKKCKKNSQKCVTFCEFRRHNSALIIDRRKFTTNWSVYGIYSFHFYS